ncbi:hypothetical protein [Sulfobacillus thermosulfidooxidans]|uniref:hypothetical protein n=1 Tax=Sulfobacillus thermosulfidooxidans TaxID=28034 RepID=UPI0006B489FD|nr:hypothetical protein [Sulfobacillus thermosulfidooxidans]
MDHPKDINDYTERVLWSLWYRRRAVTIGTICGDARLEPHIVTPILERLAAKKWIEVYHTAGQPSLYFWARPKDQDMIKTAELMHRLLWDLPLNHHDVL